VVLEGAAGSSAGIPGCRPLLTEMWYALKSAGELLIPYWVQSDGYHESHTALKGGATTVDTAMRVKASICTVEIRFDPTPEFNCCRKWIMFEDVSFSKMLAYYA
jgi:hypothetical protein